MRWASVALLFALIGDMPVFASEVDCSERFSPGRFALRLEDGLPLAATINGFSPVYLLKRPVNMMTVGAEDPCRFVYGFDVFERANPPRVGALVAGCSGDFDGDGVRDYVVLLRRQIDGFFLPHVFLARGDTFRHQASRCATPSPLPPRCRAAWRRVRQ